MHTAPRLEVAVDSVDDAYRAAAAGADRLELCANLAHHGLSPDPHALAAVRSCVSVPIVALVRPRGGAFAADEWGLMLRQASALLSAGADGIAFGCLTAEGAIDADQCREMARLCGLRTAVFHRAFDLAPDSIAALEDLVEAGVGRVLTAGMEPAETARVLGLDGVPAAAPPAESADPLAPRLRRLRSLVERARGRIEILACGGIRPGNAARFVRETGCDQIHCSCRGPGTSCVDVAMIGALRAAVAAHS